MDAICPFYKRDTAVSISCEGVLPDSNLVNYFVKGEQKRAWERCACCSHDYAKRCMIAAMHEELSE